MGHAPTYAASDSVRYAVLPMRIDECRLEDPLKKLLSFAPQKSVTRKIQAGSEVFQAGDRCDTIYSLVDGWVILYDLSEDGRRQILQFVISRALLAFSMMPDGVLSYNAKALTDITIRTVARSDFVNLCRQHPQLGLDLAWRLSQDRDLAYDHLAQLGRRPAKTRVANLLLELFVRSRLRWPGHRVEEMILPLTQEDIGDATGLTGVHVSRVLGELKQQGIVEFHYHKLRVLDPSRLCDAAEIDPDVSTSWTRARLPSFAGAGSDIVVPLRSNDSISNTRFSVSSNRKLPSLTKRREAVSVI